MPPTGTDAVVVSLHKVPATAPAARPDVALTTEMNVVWSGTTS